MKNNFEPKDRVICVDAVGTRLEQGKEYVLKDVYSHNVILEGFPVHLFYKERFEHAPAKDKLEEMLEQVVEENKHGEHVVEENKHGEHVSYEGYPHQFRRVTLTIECSLPECVNDGGVFGVTECESCGRFSLYRIKKEIVERDL